MVSDKTFHTTEGASMNVTPVGHLERPLAPTRSGLIRWALRSRGHQWLPARLSRCDVNPAGASHARADRGAPPWPARFRLPAQPRAAATARRSHLARGRAGAALRGAAARAQAGSRGRPRTRRRPGRGVLRLLLPLHRLRRRRPARSALHDGRLRAAHHAGSHRGIRRSPAWSPPASAPRWSQRRPSREPPRLSAGRRRSGGSGGRPPAAPRRRRRS